MVRKASRFAGGVLTNVPYTSKDSMRGLKFAGSLGWLGCFGGLTLTIALRVRHLRNQRGRVGAVRPEAAVRGNRWQTMLSHRVLSVIQHSHAHASASGCPPRL